MNWLKRFLGLYDKQQRERTEEVAAYVSGKKCQYDIDMAKLKKQAIKVHQMTRQAHTESIKLNEVVDDITNKIAIVTSRKH